MNKDDLVSVVAERTHEQRRTAQAMVNAMLDSIGEALERQEKVTIIGFGTFAVAERPEREGRNPRTGEPLKIAARKAPTFVPGKSLKERLESEGS